MKFFAVYDITGMILRHGRCQDQTLEAQGDFVLELAQEPPSTLDLTHYVLEGVVTPRPTFAIPSEIQLLVGESQEFSIPDPCQVTFEGATHLVTGGVLGIDGEMSATYEFKLEHWPYIPHTLKVIVQ